MPKFRKTPRLEELCLDRFSLLCANACNILEEAAGSPERVDDKEMTRSEDMFAKHIQMLPGCVLEVVLPSVIKMIAKLVRKKRSHKGLLKALEHLPQSCLRRLDMGGLYTEVRLYGSVNVQCKFLLKSCLPKLTNLTHVDLYTKCNDDILCELAKHCPDLKDLRVTMSDITDRGLMALGGVSVTHGSKGGCFKLSQISVLNCANISVIGVASVLRNLPLIVTLTYDRLADAIEAVAKIDGDFLEGKKTLNVTHLDQFSNYFEFESHPDILPILLKVCPKLESLRFYVSDDGCRSLSQIKNVKHLQLETDDLGSGFLQLTQTYANLLTLQLTFRTMTAHHLLNLGQNCPHLNILRLIGFGISSSQTLVPNRSLFKQLKILDIRMVRQPEPEEEEEEDVNLDLTDTVSFSLLHFLLDFSLDLEELTIQAVANFVDDEFLLDLIRRNPFKHMARLKLSISPSEKLDLRTAKYLIEVLPELQQLAVSRWNIGGKEFRQLLQFVRKNNYDLTFS